MENLTNKYFELARNKEVNISLTQIEMYIEGLALAPGKSIIQKLITKKLFIMTGIITMIITGSILLYFNILAPAPESSPVKEIYSNTETTIAISPLHKLHAKPFILNTDKQNPNEGISKRSNKLTDSALLIEATKKVENNVKLVPNKWIVQEVPKFQPSDHSVTGDVPADLEFNYNDGNWCLIMHESQCGFINRTGKLVVDTIYDKIWDFIENDGQWAKVMKNELYGFINRSGKLVVDCKYGHLGTFAANDGNWMNVKFEGFYGFIDRSGKEVLRKPHNLSIETIYDSTSITNKALGLKSSYQEWKTNMYDKIWDFSENDGQWAKVELWGRYNFIDRSGKEVMINFYDKIYDFAQNDGQWAKVISSGGEGFIDRSGKEVVNCIYNKIWDFNENDGQWAKVKLWKTYGFIDRSGKEITDIFYDEVYDFAENDGQWAKVLLDGKFGFIDRSGKEVTHIIYDEISDFIYNDGNWAKIKIDREYGYIDRSGKLTDEHLLNKNSGRKSSALPSVPSTLTTDSTNTGVMQIDGEWVWCCTVRYRHKHGRLNADGEYVVPPIYDDIDYGFYYNNQQWCKVKLNRKYGFIDREGNIVVKPVYRKVSHFIFQNYKYAKVRKGFKKYYLDRNGNEIEIELLE